MRIDMKAVIAVVGLWSGLVYEAAIAQTGETLSRDEAISRAVEAAYTLQSQEHKIAARGSEISQADLKPNPFLTSEWENFTGTGPFTGLDRSEVSLAYNQKLERGEKRKYRQRVASKNRDIAKIEWRLIRLNVVRLAEQAYIKTLSAQMSVDNLNGQVGIFEQALQTLEEYQARGQSSNLAVQNARLQLLNARRQVEQLRNDLVVAKQELANYWQTSDTDFMVNTDELAVLPITVVNTISSIDETPDLKYWQEQIGLAQETISLEKSKSKQDVTVNVGLRYLRGTSDVAVIAGFSMPFALHDTNINNVRRASSELSKNQIDQMEARRNIERQLLLQNQKRAAAFVQARQIKTELIPEAEKTEAIALERLQQGLANYLDVYAAQSVVANFNAQLITELERFHMAESEINRLTGKYDTENNMFEPNTQE